MKRTGTWPERPEAVGWYEVPYHIASRYAFWWDGDAFAKSRDDEGYVPAQKGLTWRLIEPADQPSFATVPLCKDCPWDILR